MVGNDQFGIFLRDTLQINNIETCGIKFSNKANTTLAFVHLDNSGDRSFSFYRKPGADTMLVEDEVDYNLIKQAHIFHFGSLSLTDEPSRSATYAAAKFAKDNGIIISYDPNYRAPLWFSEEQAVSMMKTGMQYADIVKVSDEELKLLTGTDDLAKGSAILYEMGIRVVLITLGSEGCFYRYSGGTGKIPAFNVKVVDTNGAGDAFLGGVLYWFSSLSLAEIETLKQSEFHKIISFANATGALTATRKGAIPALPCLEDVKQFINQAVL